MDEKTAKEPAKEPVKKAKTPVASVYAAEELIKNYKVFNTSREIVAVALRLANKKEATIDEATKIINAFKNKEVK